MGRSSNTCVLQERHLTNSDAIRMDQLAKRIQSKRGGTGIRAAAQEIGISPATLSRVENAKIPDLETFSRICRWLGEDPAIYLGLPPSAQTTAAPAARVHFKKGPAIKADSARALGELITAVHAQLMQEDLEG